MVLLYFTVLEKIVRESLAAVSAVSTTDSKASPVVAGGMAIHIHCSDYPDILRPTSDLDAAYLPGVESYANFGSGVGGQLQRELLNKGYQVQLKRGRGKYEVKIMNGQGAQAKELFFIHFGNLPFEIRKRQYSTFEREAAHALNVNTGTDEKPLYVMRIEDIIPRKMKRLAKNLAPPSVVDPMHHSLYQQAEKGEWDALTRISLSEWNDNLTRMQLGFPSDQKNLPQNYVVNKDLYDLCVLARKIEGDPACFNRAYFITAMSEVLKGW